MLPHLLLETHAVLFYPLPLSAAGRSAGAPEEEQAPGTRAREGSAGSVLSQKAGRAAETVEADGRKAEPLPALASGRLSAKTLLQKRPPAW